jgi:hypothetical protein
MYRLATELYPICRSITGDGVRETLRRLETHIPLTIHEVRFLEVEPQHRRWVPEYIRGWEKIVRCWPSSGQRVVSKVALREILQLHPKSWAMPNRTNDGHSRLVADDIDDPPARPETGGVACRFRPRHD